MTEEAPISVVLYASDLMFRSRVGAEAKSAERRMTSAASPAQLAEKLKATTATLILVDMDMADAVQAIGEARQCRPDAEIVAYYAHVRDDLRDAANQAGANTAMPRSQFINRLPALMRQETGPSS